MPTLHRRLALCQLADRSLDASDHFTADYLFLGVFVAALAEELGQKLGRFGPLAAERLAGRGVFGWKMCGRLFHK